MILYKTPGDLRKIIDSQSRIGKSIGFVPTMGALHAGHISLIEESRKRSDFTVCSIFVNPTQFNDPSDFTHYPVTIEKDIESLEKAGCELLFLPSVSGIYPETTPRPLHYELGYLETLLEGRFRPGHFQGVCMVVDRLLSIVRPNHLFLGQKDYQQCMVIRRLLELTGRTATIALHICPTLREIDGLAMSSRNMRLPEKDRETAPELYRVLTAIRKEMKTGDLTPLITSATLRLADAGFRPDYVEIADALTLEPVNSWDGQQKIVALAAAYLGEVRLIDNLPLNG